MKKIAIFVSGAGEGAERIVRLFNEGNRVRTSLIVVDDSATSLLDRLKNEEVVLIHVPDEEWHSRSDEVVDLLKANEVRLIVLDGFSHELTDEILEATNGEMIRITSTDQAPREVIAALEADLRKPVEEVLPKSQEEKDPTPESEWADALKIQFTPPKIPTTPPEVPKNEPVKENPTNSYQYSVVSTVGEKKHADEPMPSTWLIWSVLVTVFCCFIPGIIAIIFSSQVSSKYYAGDTEGAKRASRNAEIWIIVSVVLGVLAASFYLPFMLLGQ